MAAFANIYYPSALPGLAFSVVRRPKGNTSVETHVSGRETRLGYWTYPLYEWDLTYSVLRDFQPCGSTIPSELKRLEGFFLAMQGSLTGFLFYDPDDNFVADQVIGVGDGTTTDFLLVRTWGDPSYNTGGVSATVTEPVGAINQNATSFYLNGVRQTSGYTIIGGPTSNQIAFEYISFASAPAAGVVITAQLYFLFCVRFKDDSLDFAKFSGPPGAGFWELKKVTLVSLRGEIPPAPPPPPPPPPGPPPPPPPPPAQLGWSIDITVSAADPNGGPWNLTFYDPAFGTFVATFYEVMNLGIGFAVPIFQPPVNMVSAIADDLNDQQSITQPNLNLAVVSFYGDSTETGSANIVIKQNPWTGNATVSGTTGSAGTITITPAGPGTGIG